MEHLSTISLMISGWSHLDIGIGNGMKLAKKYHAWEQEMLSAVLTLASQTRIVSNLPIVWFTYNEALTSFLDKEPPLNKRLRRWYVFLSQFQLKVFHISGLKK